MADLVPASGEGYLIRADARELLPVISPPPVPSIAPRLVLPGPSIWISRWSPDIGRAIRTDRIRTVYVEHWTESDLSALGAVADQIEAFFVDRSVSDLGIVSEFRHLRRLGIAYSDRELASIDWARLEQLEELSLTGEKPEFGRLAEAPRLRRLSITDCGIRDLRPLCELVELEALYLQEAPLKTLTGIERLKKLVRFGVAQAPLGSLAGIGELSTLRKLVLSMLRPVASVAELAAIGALEQVSISACPRVTDLAPIGTLEGLQSLELGGRALGPAIPSVVARLRLLRELRFEGVGRIPSVEFLRALTELEVLFLLDDTVVEDGDMTPLLALPRLRRALYQQRRHYRPTKEVVRSHIAPREAAALEAAGIRPKSNGANTHG